MFLFIPYLSSSYTPLFLIMYLRILTRKLVCNFIELFIPLVRLPDLNVDIQIQVSELCVLVFSFSGEINML